MNNFMKRNYLLIITAVLLFSAGGETVSGEPLPGDVFKEYIRHWKHEGDRLRVGGELDYGGYPIPLPGSIDLEDAVKAEVEIQKLLCHAFTIELSISVNGNDWRMVPESEFIPEPQAVYQHQFNPIVELPLEELKVSDNSFRLRVNETTRIWPQNLIYGVIFRIYYSDAKPRPDGRIVLPKTGRTVGKSFEIRAETEQDLEKAEFMGFYTGFNWEGDGRFRRWHGHIFHGTMLHHIGTSLKAPHTVTFDTSWVPDQTEPMKLSARLYGTDGTIYMLPAIEDIVLERPDFAVEMCAPREVPKEWVTRKWEFEEEVDIRGDLAEASAARLFWVSWSGGYAQGIYVNGNLVTEKPTNELYRSDWNRVDVPLEYLKEGTNVIETGMTTGGGKHGMEVQWPGIVLILQYGE